MSKVTHANVVEDVDKAVYFLETMKTHEQNIQSHNEVDLGTPFHGYLISYSPEKASFERGRAGVIASRATQMVVAWHCRGL